MLTWLRNLLVRNDRNPQPRQQPVVFIVGRLVNLRPVMRRDIPLFLRWINDPEVRMFISHNLPATEKEEEQWVDSLAADKQNLVLVIETKKGRAIGIIGLHRINYRNQTATTGALIGDKAYWNRGFGTDAKMCLLEYAFNTLNLRKINSQVIAFNERSVRYSLKCGYVVEGRARQMHFAKGRFWDEIQLGLTREDWEPVWERYTRAERS